MSAFHQRGLGFERVEQVGSEKCGENKSPTSREDAQRRLIREAEKCPIRVLDR